MCTWFYADHKTLENYITRAKKSPLTNEIMLTMSRSTAMTGDIRPTDVAAVIASGRSGNIGVFPMVWGFTSEASSKPIINCRTETAEQKSLWRESWRTRRCVIPASWYYEWGVSPTAEGYNTLRQQRDIKKTRFTIQTAGAEIVFLAGLYRYEEHSGKQIPMFSIITREAVEPVRSIHDRMPLMLRQEDVRDWVQPDMNPSGIPERALTDVIMEEASV
ncbi:SOS response-associated peptidase [Ruminococcus sp. XPD3002]|uniref:SOS response-associated peptidase n=1 Tax=Ruminococcus sp. XPD3002 TaxID=1452269 RepID=UPI00091D0900|nr:SOS response associated peptidase (SRAP) [Ruminococcus flavefaciens]